MDYVSINDEDILPEQYIPDWDALKVTESESQFSEASFYLLQEAGQLLAVVASLRPKEAIVDRNEAVLLGLVVKITKVTRSIIRDASEGEIEQQISMFREFIEATANLQWLMNDNDSGDRFSMFIEDGLRAEKDMLQTISRNIEARGGKEEHIEKRMVASITDTLKASGIENVDNIRSGKELAKQGYPKIEKRIEDLNDIAYFAYRASSSSVHTTWSDIFKHHLEYNGSEFGPDLGSPRRRPQALTSIVTIICHVLPEYVNRTFDNEVIQLILPLLKDVNIRTSKLTDLHEEYLARKGEPKTYL